MAGPDRRKRLRPGPARAGPAAGRSRAVHQSHERLNGLEFQVVFEIAACLRFIVDALDVLARPDNK